MDKLDDPFGCRVHEELTSLYIDKRAADDFAAAHTPVLEVAAFLFGVDAKFRLNLSPS